MGLYELGYLKVQHQAPHKCEGNVWVTISNVICSNGFLGAT